LVHDYILSTKMSLALGFDWYGAGCIGIESGEYPRPCEKPVPASR